MRVDDIYSFPIIRELVHYNSEMASTAAVLLVVRRCALLMSYPLFQYFCLLQQEYIGADVQYQYVLVIAAFFDYQYDHEDILDIHKSLLYR